MKIKIAKPGKNNFLKFNSLIKKNLELAILISTALVVITQVQIFNFLKEQKANHFFELINNIYFEKTLHIIADNLDPKYININHIVIFFKQKFY